MKKLLSIAALGSLLAALVFLAVAPAWAEDGVDQKIKALEQELNRLKGEQMELRKDAVAAAAALPTFTYRPGNGLSIAAADRSWDTNISVTQFQLYSSFWLDKRRHNPAGGISQGAIQTRRARLAWDFSYQDFHEFLFWMDVDVGGSNTGGAYTAFKNVYFAHFERMNPWLPTFAVGDRPSFKLNPQDANLSSSTGGKSEQSLVDGAEGIITGTFNRSIILNWGSIPVGSGDAWFDVGVGVRGPDAFAQGSTAKIKNDAKTTQVGIGIKPFSKIKNPWIEGLELSFGGVFLRSPQDNFSGVDVKTDQTRFQRITLIKTDARDDGIQFYSPGIGWKMGPYQLRVAGSIGNSHRDTGVRNSDGLSIRTRGFRIMHEIWLWSPKGLLTGSPTEGGVMIAPVVDRAFVRAPHGHVLDCNSTGTGPCSGASATDSGIAFWYYTGRYPISYGVAWDNWNVSKANKDVALNIKAGTTGRHVDFNTLTFMLRGSW